MPIPKNIIGRINKNAIARIKSNFHCLCIKCVLKGFLFLEKIGFENKWSKSIKFTENNKNKSITDVLINPTPSTIQIAKSITRCMKVIIIIRNPKLNKDI